MHTVSRRVAAMVALVGIAVGVVGCGDDEAAQRKAFVAFLQSRIIDNPGIHVPQLSNEETRAFGPYAKHYEVITTFNAEMDKSMAGFLPKMADAAIVRSIADAMGKRDDIVAVREMMAKIRTSLSDNLAAAEVARKDLVQPSDLKVVYDAAFDRLVRRAANSMQDGLVLAESGMQSILALIDYLNSHTDKISLQGSIVSTSDPKIQAQVNALTEDVNAKSQRLREAQERLNKLMCGS